jgi:hypothetical protein
MGLSAGLNSTDNDDAAMLLQQSERSALVGNVFKGGT